MTLARNTAFSYFGKVKATLKQAYKDGILQGCESGSAFCPHQCSYCSFYNDLKVNQSLYLNRVSNRMEIHHLFLTSPSVGETRIELKHLCLVD